MAGWQVFQVIALLDGWLIVQLAWEVEVNQWLTDR